MLQSPILLKSLLRAAVQTYLTQDNPHDHTFFGKHISNSKGRKRAIQYEQNNISNIIDERDVITICRQVTDESLNSPLGSSTRFRRRLLQAVCTYLDITETIIQQSIGHYIRRILQYSAVTLSAIPIIIYTEEELKDRIMGLLIDIVLEREIKQLPQENYRVTQAIGNNDL